MNRQKVTCVRCGTREYPTKGWSADWPEQSKVPQWTCPSCRRSFARVAGRVVGSIARAGEKVLEVVAGRKVR